jgi:hypothetical protein
MGRKQYHSDALFDQTAQMNLSGSVSREETHRISQSKTDRNNSYCDDGIMLLSRQTERLLNPGIQPMRAGSPIQRRGAELVGTLFPGRKAMYSGIA